MQELFLVKKHEKKFEGNLQWKVFEIINVVNDVLKEGNYSSNELYQILIYRGYLAPTKQREFEKILRLGIRHGLINKDKIRSKATKEKKLPNFFTKDELMKFFSNAKDVRAGVSCFIALTSGLRVSEVTKLRVRDLDFNNELMKIVQAKGHKDRFAPFLKEYHDVVRKWIDYAKVDDYLFESYESRSMATLNEPHVCIQTLQKDFRKVLKRAELDLEEDRYKTGRKKKTFHSFRHTFATYHLGKGVSPAVVKQALGHESMDTTVNVYGHLTDSVMVNGLRGEKVIESSGEDTMTYLSKMFIEGRITEEEYKSKKKVLVGN